MFASITKQTMEYLSRKIHKVMSSPLDSSKELKFKTHIKVNHCKDFKAA